MIIVSIIEFTDSACDYDSAHVAHNIIPNINVIQLMHGLILMFQLVQIIHLWIGPWTHAIIPFTSNSQLVKLFVQRVQSLTTDSRNVHSADESLWSQIIPYNTLS